MISYRPLLHPTPSTGWMNDPNGLCLFRGEYHLFYQHNPHSTQWGNIHWGHMTSNDLLHWDHRPIALYPDTPFNKDGCFSGSAVIEEERFLLYYTGNVRQPAGTVRSIGRDRSV